MAATRSLRIGLIPGDGIGHEVVPSARRVLTALSPKLNLSFSFVDLDAGYDYFKQARTALPDKTVDTLKSECDGAVFGAVSSPTARVKEYTSPIVALRQKLDLYANVRPVKTVPPLTTNVHETLSPSSAVSSLSAAATQMISSRRSPASKPDTPPMDLVIVRENTEDLYVKEETTREDPDGRKIAEATKRITSHASERIAQMAAVLALRRARMRDALTIESAPTARSPTRSPHTDPLVTVTHKSNVLPETDGLFRKTALDVLSKPEHNAIKAEEQIIDSMFYKLFRQPWSYDVILAPNLYGDLLSDAAAALVGSLGIVPSANVGKGFAMGEPCHGSAPDIAGQGIANPIATIRSVALMLEFLGEEDAALAIHDAVDGNLADAKVMTPDMSGKAKTDEVVEDVLNRL